MFEEENCHHVKLRVVPLCAHSIRISIVVLFQKIAEGESQMGALIKLDIHLVFIVNEADELD